MLRKLHRWFGLITGVFMAVIAFTGVAMQISDLGGGDERRGPPPGLQMPPNQGQAQGVAQFQGPGTGLPSAAAQDQFRGPGGEGQGGGMNFRQLMNQIHRGRYFGTVGTYISMICGVALFFFSISGIWMYWKMYEGRSQIGRKGVFW